MSEISDWFKNIPFITRHWFGLTVAATLLGKIGILPLQYLYLDYATIFHKYQVWRPITALFAYPLSPSSGFHFLMNLFFLYSYSLRLETGVFEGRPADYIFMLTFNWLACVVFGLFMSMPFLMDPMVLSVLYIWCQLNTDQIVSFWFGTQFRAMYLPWVLLAVRVILSGGGMSEVVGIVIGHLYFFLAFKYPQDFGGASFLQTPQIFYDYFPSRRSAVQSQSGPIRRDTRPDTSRGWGSGHTLGSG